MQLVITEYKVMYSVKILSLLIPTVFLGPHVPSCPLIIPLVYIFHCLLNQALVILEVLNIFIKKKKKHLFSVYPQDIASLEAIVIKKTYTEHNWTPEIIEYEEKYTLF